MVKTDYKILSFTLIVFWLINFTLYPYKANSSIKSIHFTGTLSDTSREYYTEYLGSLGFHNHTNDLSGFRTSIVLTIQITNLSTTNHSIVNASLEFAYTEGKGKGIHGDTFDINSTKSWFKKTINDETVPTFTTSFQTPYFNSTMSYFNLTIFLSGFLTIVNRVTNTSQRVLVTDGQKFMKIGMPLTQFRTDVEIEGSNTVVESDNVSNVSYWSILFVLGMFVILSKFKRKKNL